MAYLNDQVGAVNYQTGHLSILAHAAGRKVQFLYCL